MKIDITLQDLKSRLDFVDRVLEYVDQRLAELPDGNLRIQHQGNSLTYYCARTVKGDVNGHIITDKKLIMDLAQKGYLLKVRKSAMEEQKAIRQVLKNYPELQFENIYGGLRDDRKILYWEHCGMMDKEDYADYAVNRFNKYSKEGIILGKNLFASFETGKHPMDTEAVDKLINAHFK